MLNALRSLIVGSARSNRSVTPRTKGITLHPIRREHISAEQFMRELEDNPGNIKSSEFKPPRIGDADFGHFEVEYKRPKFTQKHG